MTINGRVVSMHTEEVDAPKSEIKDEDIEELASFPRIKTLIIGENPITDAGLSSISKGCPKLRKLFLNHTEITSAGLSHLSKLK